MSKNSNKRLGKTTPGHPKGSQSSPVVGKSTNDKVASGSNPRFSPFKGIGKLQTGQGTKAVTKAATKKVAIASGVKNITGPGTKRASHKPRPTRQTYPSKRLMAIMDPEERPQF